MRPAPADPFPRRSRRVRSDALFLIRCGRPAVHAAVVRVLTELYPRRRSAGMLSVLVFLSVAALHNPAGVYVGHGELADRFGVSRRTLVTRLGEWRNSDRMLNRRVRGRKNVSVTLWEASDNLIRAVANDLRARTDKHGKRKAPKVFHSQRANLPHVAAPTGRPGLADIPARRPWSRSVDKVPKRAGGQPPPIAEVLAELYRRD